MKLIQPYLPPPSSENTKEQNDLIATLACGKEQGSKLQIASYGNELKDNNETLSSLRDKHNNVHA